MKGLQILFVCCVAASALAQSEDESEASTSSRSSSSGKRGSDKGNTRLFGGLHGGLGGHRPGFGGGHRPGFGGGHRPGFGGGHRPGFGGAFNPGFGGVNPGIGGFNPGFGGGFGGGVSQTCRRWCRTPKGQAYCCESNNEPDTLPFVKPGKCPPVRPQCPPVRNFAPPQSCSNDSKCGGIDKCCFDTCLQQHVCKPPIGSSGFGGFGR